jgi:UDP-4-amino-4,6-dideoxy-N-acetyl-beta-L-altrosamine transaminase
MINTNASFFLPYGRQNIDASDIAAVIEALHSEFLTTGPLVERFEKALAEYCGDRHAIAVANGTAALHVAVLAAGLKPGQRLLTSANTFLASANCAEFVGATADFADIDAHTYNVTAATLRAAWRDDVRVVVPVDFAGQSCEMTAIAALAREHGALVIEDASHSVGSTLAVAGQLHKVGGHPWADMTTFSFHPVKTITTGEGGAILTNDDRLAERCRLARCHGMVRSPAPLAGLGDTRFNEFGPWYYEMPEVGFNYRITDFQCALGIRQLQRLDNFIDRRQQITDAYNRAFTGQPFLTTPRPAATRTAWHLYVIQINFAVLGKTRTQVMAELRQRGIGTQVHYIPVHLQPHYRQKYGYAVGKCPTAEAYYQRCLSLPLYPDLTDADVQRVIAGVKEVVTR